MKPATKLDDRFAEPPPYVLLVSPTQSSLNLPLPSSLDARLRTEVAKSWKRSSVDGWEKAEALRPPGPPGPCTYVRTISETQVKMAAAAQDGTTERARKLRRSEAECMQR
jgi:hypothetical protein